MTGVSTNSNVSALVGTTSAPNAGKYIMANKQLPDSGYVYGIIITFTVVVIWNTLNNFLQYLIPVEGVDLVPAWEAWIKLVLSILSLYIARQAWRWVKQMERLMATHPVLGHHFRKKVNKNDT